jgi:TonB family protein
VGLLNGARVYPRDALAREESGIVTLLVEIAPDGTLVREEVEKPSPYTSLNRAAEDTVKRVGKFPAPPSEAPLTLHVPIHFKISFR